MKRKRYSIGKILNKNMLLIALALVITIFSLIQPKFFSLENLLNILAQGTPLGIATVGMAIIIIQGGIDLSAGSIVYLSMVICSQLFKYNVGIEVYILISLACGAFLGAINGVLISYLNVVPFIATLGTQALFRGLGLTISGQKMSIFPESASSVIINTKVFGIPLMIVIFAMVLIVAQIVLSRTQFGRQLYAIGNNEGASLKIGIKIKKIRFIVYLIAGMLVGLGGLITAIQISAVPAGLAEGSEFNYITAAVIGGISLFGGKGTILPGVLLGVLIVTSINNGLVIIGANAYFYQIILGAIIAFAVAIDSINYKGELR